MRDLSCYLSSFSVHAFAVALITAAGVFEAPDFAVTSGGISISGSMAEVAVDTRSEFEETLPPKTEASADPFRVPVTDVASSAANRQPPESAAVSALRKPRRSTAGSRQVLIETIVIPHEGLLEWIGEESTEELQQVAENQPAAQEEDSRRGAEEVASENKAVPVDTEKAAPQKDSTSPAPLPGNPQPARKDSREVAKTAKEKQEADEPAESSPIEPATPTQKKTSSKNSQAAPSANESSGAKVDQLPQKLPSNPSPDYPLEAWQKRQEGLVYLLVRVTASGRAETVRVYRSSGFTLLDSAAKKAVGSWRFRPASRAGKAVASPVVVPVRFQIQRQ